MNEIAGIAVGTIGLCLFVIVGWTFGTVFSNIMRVSKHKENEP